MADPTRMQLFAPHELSDRALDASTSTSVLNRQRELWALANAIRGASPQTGKYRTSRALRIFRQVEEVSSEPAAY